MFAQTSFCLSHFLPSCLFDSFYVFALDVKGRLGCNVSCNLFGKKLWLKPHGKAKAQWIPPEITGLFIIFTNRFFQAEKNSHIQIKLNRKHRPQNCCNCSVFFLQLLLAAKGPSTHLGFDVMVLIDASDLVWCNAVNSVSWKTGNRLENWAKQNVRRGVSRWFEIFSTFLPTFFVLVVWEEWLSLWLAKTSVGRSICSEFLSSFDQSSQLKNHSTGPVFHDNDPRCD